MNRHTLIRVLLALFLVFSLIGCKRTVMAELESKITEPETETVQPKETTAKNESTEESTEESTGYYGQLHVEGTKICDENNNPVQLKGISTHGLGWFPEYVNSKAIQEFHDNWNMNVFRLAMYTAENNGYCSSDSKQKEQLKSIIHDGIKAAQNADMYVIVDWHILQDNNPLTNVDEAKAFFDEISSFYKNDAHIIYEICNEPNGNTSWDNIQEYANQVIPVIRENAPDAVIIVGTPTWSQDVDVATKSPLDNYDNIVYALHFYADTHRDNLRDKMVQAIDNGLPIFVSEFGICDASGNGAINASEANKWIDLLNEHNVSYVAWNLSNKSESSAIINENCKKTSGFEESDLTDSGKWLKSNLLAELHEEQKNNTTTIKNNSTESTKTEASTNANTGTDANTGTNVDADATIDTDIEIVTAFSVLSATAILDNSWEEEGKMCYLYHINLENSSSEPIEDWSATINFDSDGEIINFWGCSASIEKGIITILPADYNTIIEGNSSITDIGIIVKK